MKFKTAIRIPFNVVKYTIISIVVLVGIILSLPYLFPTYVSNQIKTWANDHIESELAFSKARLSFFEHFPSLTLTLHDFSVKGSAPFETDTLVSGKRISLGVNLLSLFGSSVNINEIYLSESKMNIQVNKAGVPNYNIYTASASPEAKNKPDADTTNTSLKLEKIQIDDCELVYNDGTIPFRLAASRVNYIGKGDLDRKVFDLQSKLEMDDVSLSYDNDNYFINKQLKAKLLTKVNTGSLQLIFENNDLRINELPLTFKGQLDFLDNGYMVDVNIASRKATFRDLFTALPPAAVQWLKKTTVKGDIQMTAQLKGKYAVAENAAPDLQFGMEVSKGSIVSDQTTTPVKNILLRLSCSLPKLSVEGFHLKIDTVHAELDKQFVEGSFELNRLDKAVIHGSLSAIADMAAWTKTLATENFADLRGMLNMKASVKGSYNKASGTWPVTVAALNYKNGYIKTSHYPNALTDINADIVIENPTGTNKDLRLSASPIAFTFEGKPFTITTELHNLDNLQYKITSKGVLDIGRIYRVFAIEGYDIDGRVATDLSMQGSQADINAKHFAMLQHRGRFQLHKISIGSKDFPKPLIINDGSFQVANDRIIAEAISCRYGNTHAKIVGEFRNIINYLLLDSAALTGKLTVAADVVDLAEFMSPVPGATITADAKHVDSSTSTGVILIPRNLDLGFDATVEGISYNGIQLKKFRSVTSVSNGSFIIDNAAFEIIGSPVKFRGTYYPKDIDNIRFTASISANEFDVKKAFNEIALFREMAPSASRVEGIVSLDYTLSGRLDSQMHTVLPSLKGGGVLTLKKVKLNGFKMLSEIGKRTGKELDDSPDLSKVELKTSVENNIMTLQKTKLRIAGFRPKFHGQASLDGKLNLHCRLGLPPFGIIGIPLTITGTQDKPMVKFRSGRKTDTLQETSDDADEEDKADAEAASRPGGQ